MVIKLLIENNTNKKGILTEHGISFFIEYENKKILFDSGQSEKFLQNSKTLNIDLSNLDFVFISHGHYDHAGGLKTLLENHIKKLTIHVGEGFFDNKGKNTEIGFSYLGVPFSKDELETAGALFKEVEKDLEVSPGIHLITNVENKKESYFYIKNNDNMEKDGFKEELSLVFETKKGLVVVVGCSHCGIFSILSRVKKKFPNDSIYALVGGFHYMKESNQTILEAGKKLLEQGIAKIGLSHCTGLKFGKLMLDESFFSFNAGDTIEI